MLELRLETGGDVEANTRRICERALREQGSVEFVIVGEQYDEMERAAYILASIAASLGLRLGHGMWDAPDAISKTLCFRINIA